MSAVPAEKVTSLRYIRPGFADVRAPLSETFFAESEKWLANMGEFVYKFHFSSSPRASIELLL